jgi:hypothetical protein
MSLHSERVFIDWVIGILVAGGLTVGDGVAPQSVPTGSGYVVVYSIAGGVTTGTIDNPNEDASPTFQITSVSAEPRQCRWLVDRARELINAAVPVALDDGRKVIWINFPMASVTIIRDDDVQPPKWYAPDRIEVGTS